MKKSFFLFLWFGILFLGIQTNVYAANVSYTCDYTYYYQLAGWSSRSTISFYDNDSTPTITIYSFNHQDISHKPFSNEPKEYKISNLSDVKGTFNGSCPNYALIYYSTGSTQATSVSTYISNDKSYLEGKIKSLWDHNHYHIAVSKDFASSGENSDQYYNSVVNHTNHINSEYQNYTLDGCKVETDVINRITKCNDIYNALNQYMNSSESEVNAWIKQKYISENDQRVIDYFNALKNARERWKEVKRELDQEQQQIDYEMGITDEKPDIIPDGSELPVDLDLKKYCTEPNVARTLKFLGMLLFIAKIFVPALIIILGSIDFGQVILAGKDDEIKKRLGILIKRIIAGIIIFFIPSIIEFLFSVLDGYSDTVNKFSNCRTCILDPDSCQIHK